MFVSLIVGFCVIYFGFKSDIKVVQVNQLVMVENQEQIKNDLSAYKINQFDANKLFM